MTVCRWLYSERVIPIMRALVEISNRNPGKMCACIDFDGGLAHTIYAASDIFLMPSIFEPCGLSQLVSMAYGSVPVVRETGGLKDTVTPYNEFTGEGNGFSFTNINAHEFCLLQSMLPIFIVITRMSGTE